MKKNTIIGIAMAIAGCIGSTQAISAYKCATKDGITYQDKPCAGSPQTADIAISTERERRLERQLVPTPVLDRAHAAVKLDPRKEEELAELRDWQERSAQKSSSLRACARGEVACSPKLLRTAALYLPESQLEQVLGSPVNRETTGMARASRWIVPINNEGHLQTVKLTAAFGLCSDEKSYFAAGTGVRACRVSID